ncbi:MAG: TlyA family RNA methyltransferase [Betaproteobacteria bacterium]|nr:TlyA family RNA methyltransferase [Betaproteobacteria bacterium]
MSMNSFHARSGKPRAQPAQRPSRAAQAGARADQLLVERGLAPSRTAAQRLIAAARVQWRTVHGDRLIEKPAELLPDGAELIVAEDADDRFVSRGGLKLAGALAATQLDVRGRCCLDLGQSTGGFTDCLLQAGVAKVIGIEVGHGQLHARLAGDPRVVTFEGVNARALTARDLGEHWPEGGFDLVTGDLSFISLTLILPAAAALMKAEADLLMLVKPQFEVGPQGLAKGGIVRDTSLYADVETKIRAACAANGLQVQGWFHSPITGADGNHEFFIHARRALDARETTYK